MINASTCTEKTRAANFLLGYFLQKNKKIKNKNTVVFPNKSQKNPAKHCLFYSIWKINESQSLIIFSTQ